MHAIPDGLKQFLVAEHPQNPAKYQIIREELERFQLSSPRLVGMTRLSDLTIFSDRCFIIVMSSDRDLCFIGLKFSGHRNYLTQKLVWIYTGPVHGLWLIKTLDELLMLVLSYPIERWTNVFGCGAVVINLS